MTSVESRESAGTESRFFYGYLIVILAFFAMTVMFGTYFSFGVFLKPVLTEFGWTRAMTSGAFSLSMIVFGLLSIVMGGLNDRYGPRIVLTLCGILSGLGYLMMSQISAIWQFYLLYGVVIGIGMSAAFVPVLSTVARWFVDRRSLVTGIVVAGTGVGGLIFPLAATQLILAYDWHMSYIVLGCVVLVITILVAQFMRRDPGQMGKVSYTKNRVASRAKPKTKDFSFGEVLYTRKFWLALGIEFCLGFCSATILVHIAPHAIELGISATGAASILATMSGSSVAGRVMLGGVGDRIGSRGVFIVVFIVKSAAMFWLMSGTELWKLYLFAVVFGFAYGGAVASESPLAATLFGLTSHGSILGVFNFVGTLGASLGPFLAGYIFDTTSSYQVAFLISAGVAILGLIFSVVLMPIKSVVDKI